MIGLDERGPVTAKAYPRPSWAEDAHRPHLRPSYARHGYHWAFGALEHRSGPLSLQTAATRHSAAWLHFLDGLQAVVPAGAVYLIAEGLPLHGTMDTMVCNWSHVRFHCVPLPKAAAWLHRIAGFWKILRQRALAGRVCASTQQVEHAVHAGVADWNRRPTPFVWGRTPKPRRHLKRRYVYRI